MKKLLLSISALFIFFGTASAVDYDSIYLSDEATEHMRAVEDLITITPLTQKIEEAGSFRSYWINPFRNIQRSLRTIPDSPDVPYRTIDKLNRFIDTALRELNSTGKIKVYGYNEKRMNYFLKQDAFYFGGFKN